MPETDTSAKSLVELERGLLDKGLQPNGVKVAFKTKEARNSFRMRLYRRREADRKEVAQYTGKPLHPGISPYDVLVFAYCETKAGKPCIHIMQGFEGMEILEDGDE